MRIVLIGQAAFGESVLKRLLEAGKEVVGVSTPPDRGSRVDPLKALAEASDIPWLPTRDLRNEDTYQQFAGWEPDLGVMAFVTDILPEKVLEEPKLGTIQYHPSLLPRHRGASAINWAIVMGDTTTGLTIFWPDKGIDTGPVLLQKEASIDPDDTVGTLYFDKLFPLGVDAMVESVELVEQGTAPKLVQDESQATYEPIFKDEHAAIDWSKAGQQVYDLVRGSTPAPGAATTIKGQVVELFESRFEAGDQSGDAGHLLAVTDDGIRVAVNGGILLVQRARVVGGQKVSGGAQLASELGLEGGRPVRRVSSRSAARGG